MTCDFYILVACYNFDFAVRVSCFLWVCDGVALVCMRPLVGEHWHRLPFQVLRSILSAQRSNPHIEKWPSIGGITTGQHADRNLQNYPNWLVSDQNITSVCSNQNGTNFSIWTFKHWSAWFLFTSSKLQSSKWFDGSNMDCVSTWK